MGAFVINLGAAASYADTGANSISAVGSAATLAVKVRVSGQLLQNAANGFIETIIAAVGGATQGSARLTIICNGSNGDVRVKLGVGDFANTGHTAEMASGISVTVGDYYDIYGDFGSNAGFIGIAKDGVELGSATRGAATMGTNASNGRVRVGAELWTTTNGATGRVDGISVHTAKFTTTSDRYGDPDTVTSSQAAYWPFHEGSGTTSTDQSGNAGPDMVFSATSAPTWVAGGTWDGGGGGGGPTGKPTHAMYYARLRAA